MSDWDPNVEDADRWVTCDQGHSHWGSAGAAGLLLHNNGRYLLQHRAPWVDHGGTWAPPSGALRRGEHPISGAVREAQEEMGEFPFSDPKVIHTADHGGWAFHTVTAEAPHQFEPQLDDEGQDHGWFTPHEIDELPLHPGFRQSWSDIYQPPSRQTFSKTAMGVWGPDGSPVENPMEKAYHVAPRDVRHLIETQGLKASGDPEVDPQPAVFMTPLHPQHSTDPYYWRPDRQDVYEVNVDGLPLHHDPWGEEHEAFGDSPYLQDLGGSVYHAGDIEPSRVRRLNAETPATEDGGFTMSSLNLGTAWHFDELRGHQGSFDLSSRIPITATPTKIADVWRPVKFSSQPPNLHRALGTSSCEGCKHFKAEGRTHMDQKGRCGKYDHDVEKDQLCNSFEKRKHSRVAGEELEEARQSAEPKDQASPEEAQVLDQLTIASVAHNLHYKYEKGPLTVAEASQYAGQLLDMIGYRNPDPMTIGAALQAWQQLYPQDKALSARSEQQRLTKHLYHWTEARDLEHWMDPAHTGPGETYLTESGEAPGEDWNPDVPTFENPVRLAIDPSHLDPQGFDPNYEGWLGNHLYRGVIPPEAVKDVKSFKPAQDWDLMHYASDPRLFSLPDPDELDDLLPGTASEPTVPEPYYPSATAAAAHSGQIPGDEHYMQDVPSAFPNPNSGVNPSYIGHIGEDTRENRVYVKPEGQFHSNDLAAERAAFAIAHTMGIPMPHTVVRPVSFSYKDHFGYDKAVEGLAQVQQSVGGRQLIMSHTPHTAAEEFPEGSRRIGLLDNVIGNDDRHLGNVVQGDDGELYPIDHGGAFVREGDYKPRGLAGAHAGTPLTPEEIEALQRARQVDLSQIGLRDTHQEGVHKRIDTMLANGQMLDPFYV